MEWMTMVVEAETEHLQGVEREAEVGGRAYATAALAL